MLNRMNKLTNKADSFAHGVKEHEKLSHIINYYLIQLCSETRAQDHRDSEGEAEVRG